MAGVESTLNLNRKNNTIIILKKILWRENISSCNAGDPGLILGLGRSAGEEIVYPLQYSWPSLMAQLVKKIHPQYWRPGFNLWIVKIPWRRERLPTPVFWPGEFWTLTETWLSLFIISTDHIKCSVMSDYL